LGEFTIHGGPRIFVVATPIGNLGELSPRAREVLEAADLIAAEDTRVVRKLLSHLGLKGKKTLAYHDHGEAQTAQRLISEILAEGQILALVSDAGTPCISDPGYHLISAAHAAGIPVHPVAGPSSPIALASVAGLAASRFTFVGFLPRSARDLTAEISSWRNTFGGRSGSVIFLESPRRLSKTLTRIAAVHPDARVAVGRELTKLHEEVVVGDVGQIAAWAEAHASLRGEAVVMVELGRSASGGASASDAAGQPAGIDAETDPEDLREILMERLRAGSSVKDLLQEFTSDELPRKSLYRLLLDLRAELGRS